ncbi:hypothetical protein WR25_05343 [Diploscapter pachys]|uniref:O-acyltransferase n=1 Tax=Diploscapter pachys TaxID=2018661 RepID=A0A2A2K9Q1_9BILA|nr:hypothetical protein WR25_05343 [Diploscapter pachys]
MEETTANGCCSENDNGNGMDDGSSELRQRHPSQESRQSQNSFTSNGMKRKMSFAQKKDLDRKKGPAERVIHQAQDSLFSSSSGWTNYRGFFNLAMLLLVVSNGRVALENLIKYGILISPLDWLSLFFNSDLSLAKWPNITLIVMSNVTILLVFITEKLLQHGYLGNTFAGMFYPIVVSLHIIIPAVVTLSVEVSNPIFSVAALGIYVIEALKIVSYVHVNYWGRCAREEIRAIKEKKSQTTSDLKDELSMYEMASLYPSTVTLSNLYYFMLTPTLCYEFRFPRTYRIRKHFLAKRLFEVIFLFFLMASLLQQWIIPTVRNSMGPLSEMEYGRVLERLLKLAVPNILIWLIFFYTLFHSALNLVAELLCFADREFYRDFWNAETIAYFWKTWNIPVHRFALRHCYLPMTRHKYSRLSATIVVFCFSAFFHEYLVSVPLKMFRLWACYGMMSQVPLSFVTDYVVRGGRAGNIIVWLSLILGQPLAILMYVHDWYIYHAH